MSAPDDEIKPDAVDPSPEALASGQRTLAAIVFTDTVGFSALMSKEEERTLRLVARDLDQMKATCQAFGGQVLKSTGDGLLMLFTSAVQAVACALEIQRDLQKKNLDLPRTERLQHRIGIHLGDVFQHGNDVMGDGVNIAARLQAQAVPGGICLSKTVYDVVHNRLAFYVNDLGARKLKNIGKVTAYQISPAEDGATGLRFGRWYHWRPWVFGGVGLVILSGVLITVFKLGMYRQWLEHHSTHIVANDAASSMARPSVPQQSKAATPSPALAVPLPAGVSAASQTEFDLARFNYMRRYDFEGMRTWIQTHDWLGKSTSKLGETCGQLDHLFNWCYQQLQKYPADKPLLLTNSSGKTFALWPAPFDGINIKTDTLQRTLARNQIAPLTMVGMANELIKENGAPGDPVIPELQRELQLFVRVYQIKLPGSTPPAAIPLSQPASVSVQRTVAPLQPESTPVPH